jgi:hypothetical protein
LVYFFIPNGRFSSKKKARTGDSERDESARLHGIVSTAKKEGHGMDVVSILLLALSFGVFFALIKFCDAVVREQGGKEK